MSKSITVKFTSNYGNMAVYPVCKDAHTFARLGGTKTLTLAALKLIEELGYTIQEEMRPAMPVISKLSAATYGVVA